MLVVIEPLLAPMALVGLFLAWVVPELFANRGAVVVRVSRRRDGEPERVAQGLLGDCSVTRSATCSGRRDWRWSVAGWGSGWWVRREHSSCAPAAGIMHAFCVRVAEADLPRSDRIAHLLLALREDEQGFATVANHAFTGATWRLRRRIPAVRKPALDVAVSAARI